MKTLNKIAFSLILTGLGTTGSFAQMFSVAPIGDPELDVAEALTRGGADTVEYAPDGSGGEDTATSDGGSVFPLSFFTNKPFRVTLSVREGFDDNVNASHENRHSSFYTNFAAGINYSFGSPRLKLSTNLSGGLTYYYSKNANRKTNLSGLWNLSAVYSVTPRMTLSMGTSTGYYSQPTISNPGTSYVGDQSYFSTNTYFSLNYQWTERFSTTTGYRLGAIVYSGNRVNDGLGNISQTISQSFNFHLWPTTTLVAEYRVNPVTYFSTDQDSWGNYFLLGFNHTFNPRSTWTLRAGAELRFMDRVNSDSKTYIGPYIESVFRYQLNPRSSVAWTLRYGTENSGVFNITQSQTFRTGLNIDYAITSKLSASAGAYYTVSYYNQRSTVNPFYQNAFEGFVGLRYSLNQRVSFSAGYRYTGVLAPEQDQRNYYRNVVYIGVNTNF
ncbi:MAG: hypothetical protein ACK5LK_02305 [Chthoniobacterales bacterium]